MQKNYPKRNRLQWFHTHRIRIALLSIIIILPLTLVVLAYVGTYNANKKVAFEELTNEDVTYIKKFDDLEDLKYIDLSVDWVTLKYPEFNEDGSIDSSGYYQFRLTYASDENYDVTSVEITPVLQTNWIDYRSLGSLTSISENTGSNILIPFNEVLPVRRLLFIQVTDPILYLKVDVTYETVGQSFEETQYVSIQLKDELPENVVGGV